MIYLYQQIKKTVKVLGLLLFTIATSFCSYAQDNKDEDIDGLLDELFFSDKKFLDELIESDFTYNILYTSVSYNNNTFFSGRDAGTDQFHIIPQISYYHSSGFNASISGVYYQEFYPHWDFTTLSLGYFNTIGKQKIVNYNVGYTKYFYSHEFDAFTNSFDINIGVRNKKRTLGTNISASYLFGTDQSYQIVSNSFVNFTLKRGKDFALRLRSSVNFIIAKQSLAVERLSLIGRQRVLQIFNYSVFDLLNTQINIPFSITTKSWDFELGYNVNLPNAVLQESNLKTTGFFSLSVGYLFDLKK